MGVEDAFTNNADFSNTGSTRFDQKLSITKILQKTCIAVNENGSQQSKNIDSMKIQIIFFFTIGILLWL